MIRYHDIHHDKPFTKTTDVDISFTNSYFADLIKHRFPPKTRPVKIDVNAREGRRAICVLYGEGLRYEVLDMDAEMGDEDKEGEE
jgi:anaphase-promoting complex subunit 4